MRRCGLRLRSLADPRSRNAIHLSLICLDDHRIGARALRTLMGANESEGMKHAKDCASAAVANRKQATDIASCRGWNLVVQGVGNLILRSLLEHPSHTEEPLAVSTIADTQPAIDRPDQCLCKKSARYIRSQS
jgi:hypothetical protein